MYITVFNLKIVNNTCCNKICLFYIIRIQLEITGENEKKKKNLVKKQKKIKTIIKKTVFYSLDGNFLIL